MSKKNSLSVLEQEIKNLIISGDYDSAEKLISKISISSPFIELCKVNLLTNKKKYSEAESLFKIIPEIDNRIAMADLFYICGGFRDNLIIKRFDTCQWILNNWKIIEEEASSICHEKILSVDEMPIFTFWNTGEKSAPFIVRHCIEQMQKVFGNKVIILDEDSVKYYVDTTLMKGITRWAHKADYIRSELLMRYGGTWIDSTVLVNYKLLEFRRKHPTFFAAYPPSYRQLGNWLMSVNISYSYFYCLLHTALSLFLKKYKDFNQYFMFHVFWKTIVSIDKNAKIHWEKAGKINASEAIRVWSTDGLVQRIDNTLIEQRYVSNSCLKLSYRYDYEAIDINSNISKLVRLSKGIMLLEEKVPENINQLKKCNNYFTYIEALFSFRKDLIIFITSKDCHTPWIEENRKRKEFSLSVFNISTDLRFAFRESWLCIIDEGIVKKELHNKDSEVCATYDFAGNNFEVTSAGWNVNNSPTTPIIITVNGKQLAINRRGLNLVIWDKNNNKMVDSVCFDTFANNEAFR